MNETYQFKFGDKVSWDSSKFPVGFGSVVGVSSTSMPIMGRWYIVHSPDVFTDEYPFSYITLPESALTLVQKQEVV